MKKLNLLFVLLFVSAMSLQAEDLVAVISPTTPLGSNFKLSPQDQVRVREEISFILGDNEEYTLLAWEQIDMIISTIIATHGPGFKKEACLEAGQLLGVQKLILTEVVHHADGFYRIYCKQINATTARIEKQGQGQIKCMTYLNLAAREAAAIFSKDPQAVRKEVKGQKKDVGCPDVEGRIITNPFRIKMNHTNWGISFEYLQQEWEWKYLSTGITEKRGYLGEGPISGAQLGFRYDKYFAPRFFGLGIHTGLSVGYYAQKGKPDSETERKLSFDQVTLSIPLQGIYRLDFSKHIGCYVTCGLSADIGLYSRVKVTENQQSETFTNIYDDDEWGNMKRFNYSLTYGAGVQIDRFMLSVSLSKGLLNQSDDASCKIYQNKKIQATFTFMF
ncbi:porin family protein [uncultured Bacteroides sp.]|uniref:porin family protein n=1 Tax=uncultured Bacteroides sp. TaxID=162156 RepID=UPI0025F6A0A4|nr:porin family protein [uncultured Bacteroides sp.]